MGKVRARTGAEVAARRAEIVEAAGVQLMDRDYVSVTLATIADAVSVSRPSVYHYYPRKEDVFIDLLVREYLSFAEGLARFAGEPMGREAFCRELAADLWSRQLLLKLLSLQLPVWDAGYDDGMLVRFVRESMPYAHALDAALAAQFPGAPEGARESFKVQFSLYCNSLYVAGHLPAAQAGAIVERGALAEIPAPEEICFQGLMLLSAPLGG